jgi:hypothetical protein
MSSETAAVDPHLRVIEGAAGEETERVLELLDRTVRVIVPGTPPLWRHQVLAITFVDLLARLHPRIEIICHAATPAAEGLPPGPATLFERLEEARRRGHPPQPPNGEPIVTLFIGAGGDGADIYVDALGWQSYLGDTPSRLPKAKGPAVAVGPACAAARGAARVFQLVLAEVIEECPPLDSIYWSALDYRSSEEPLDCPGATLPAPARLDALLVGAGSVGGAATHTFACTPQLDGEFDACDPQTLEERNYVKALLADRANAAALAEKAALAAAALDHLPLVATPHRSTIEELVASRPRESMLPLVLCAVDSVESRRAIQDCLPLELINAGCNGSNASVTSHRTDDGPCVYCLHIEKVLDSEEILVQRIAARTGMPKRQVLELIVTRERLQKVHLCGIERHLGKPDGALAAYEGALLEELYRGALVYGEVPVGGDGVQAAVAAPFITALAGFLLAAEALKAGTPALASYRLGAAGDLVADGGARPTKYEESLFASPRTGLLMPLPRWPTNECLCRSQHRLRLLRERCGLDARARDAA